MAADEPPDESTSRVDYRQVSLVVLAAAALVLGAFFAPAAGGVGLSLPDANPPPEAQESADGDAFDWFDLFDWIEWIWEPSDPPEVDTACTVWLNDDPTPGREVTATIHYEGEPLADAPVWFDDRRIGQTDESGRVTGEVPYVRELVIQVGTGEQAECRAVGSTTLSGAGERTELHQDLGSLGTSRSDPDHLSTVRAQTQRVESVQQGGQPRNATAEYEIDGDVRIGVRGEPYPDETLTVVAEIDGVPMRSADVTVDETTVGETDDDGTAAVTVPDDGSDRIEIGVARGEFDGTTSVDVLLLETTLEPDGIAPVPGSDGAVLAETADEPVDGASVAVDGEPRGTTGPDGTMALELPRDPTTPVTVTTDDQTATTSLFAVYWWQTLLFGSLVGGFTAVGYGVRGVRGGATVLGAATALAAGLVVEAFYGPLAGLGTLAIVLSFGVGVAAVRSDRTVTVRTPSIRVRNALGRLLEWIIARTLGIVSLLEAGLDRVRSWVGALRRWIASIPRSVTGIALAVAGWLASVPGRILGALARLLRGTSRAVGRLWPPRVRTVVGGLGATLIVAVTYVEFGRREAAVVAATLAAAGLVLRWFGRSETGSAESVDSEPPRATSPTTGTTDENHDRPFREVWRSFARSVAPRKWRTRTPGEIERRALEQGYPPDPVAELTTLFRDVEYGGRPRSRAVRARANDVYADIVADRGDGDASTTRERRDEAEHATPSPGQTRSIESDRRSTEVET
ncbi:DUF4129 domain-containing protein [Natrarchaeobius chitinivorans]|uniref:DUF4129 domain-containing protein n=1 Tax=Natrarchaeobius chitinivorans TaxID=1679083 RepID=A0A3N6ME53_NATCH|nr:DUF4129 domain-containing protein [Natrarchaeobius chitinivorans]RQG92116.1 DUF4129 domain-containing protein [Natrarchaeobius chitinivorans]